MLLGEQPVGGAYLRRRAAAVQAEHGVMIFSSALQFPKNLPGAGIGGSFMAAGRELFAARQQVCALEQPAKIFFTGDLPRAFPGREAGHGFVFHLKAFKTDDAEVLSVFFPDLALAKFHEARESVSYTHLTLPTIY